MNALLLAVLISQDPSRGVGFDQRLGEELPLELSFRDETGAAVRLRDAVGGRPAIVAFVYYRCPMLCMEVLSGLVRTLRAVPLDAGRDFVVVAVSIDPREESGLAAARKEEWLRRYGRPGSEGGWRFLTGDAAPLAAAAGFRYRYEPATGEYAHPAGILVVTPEGRNARYFLGIDYPARELRLSLVEASRGRIGSATDRLLLLCLRYDAASGRYGFAIMTAVRAGGVATVLALAAFAGLALRRERLRKGLREAPPPQPLPPEGGGGRGGGPAPPEA